MRRYRNCWNVNKVADGVDDTLRERYVNKIDKEGDGSTPGLIDLLRSIIST